MQAQARTVASGSLGLTVIRGGDASGPSHVIDPHPEPHYPARPVNLDDIRHHALPRSDLPATVNQWRKANLRNLWRGARQVAAARALGVPLHYGQLWLTVIRGDGRIEELGLASMRVVTDAGVNFIVDAFQGTTELENLKYHGFGTGGTAEAAAQTALVTEETTQYNPDNTRPTGSTIEGASANIYRTVATYSPDSGTNPRPITEHGIFSQAATGGGTMLDRSLFSVVNLAPSADSLQATFDYTLPSGG
jgi:hypothetical protein